jgi:hypothetical protein
MKADRGRRILRNIRVIFKLHCILMPGDVRRILRNIRVIFKLHCILIPGDVTR